VFIITLKLESVRTAAWLFATSFNVNL